MIESSLLCWKCASDNSKEVGYCMNLNCQKFERPSKNAKGEFCECAEPNFWSLIQCQDCKATWY